MIGFLAFTALAIFIAAEVVLRPGTGVYGCDGSYPKWMLDAQGYKGGGCAHVLPSNQAPPDADWTMYCLGMCGPDAEHVWP
jgi:hypothetical protein